MFKHSQSSCPGPCAVSQVLNVAAAGDYNLSGQPVLMFDHLYSVCVGKVFSCVQVVFHVV